jgi:hypothetical protein
MALGTLRRRPPERHRGWSGLTSCRNERAADHKRQGDDGQGAGSICLRGAGATSAGQLTPARGLKPSTERSD